MLRFGPARFGLLIALAAFAIVATMPVFDEARAADRHGTAPSARPRTAAAQCTRHKPQPFLIRGNYLPVASSSPADIQRRTRMHQRALQYRLDKYGSVDGVGASTTNSHPVTYYLQQTTFMGHGLQVHRRIAGVLHCVEADLHRSCRATPYEPKAVGGYRDRNTYHHGEVTNHLFGIAIDIDPELNPCCGCVDPWPENPRCKPPARSVFDRMTMPECWVRVFERHGFYWLGHDQLQDTMHFEFLGNPDRLGP